MDSLRSRNSPFSLFSVKFDAEILPSLYKRGDAVAFLRGMLQ